MFDFCIPQTTLSVVSFYLEKEHKLSSLKKYKQALKKIAEKMKNEN